MLTRTSAFSYNPTNGLLISEAIEPDDGNLRLTKSYTHDQYGNVLTSTVGGPSIASRTSSQTYDARGQFPLTVLNALGHSASATFDSKFGNKLTATGPNGLTTSWIYDSLGRLTLETRADGTKTTMGYNLCETNCTGGYPMLITTTADGSVPVTVYFDQLGREVMKMSKGFDGTDTYKVTSFDENGRVKQVSKPYYASEAAQFTSYEYDVIGRLIKETKADGSATNVTYSVLQTINTNDKGQTITKNKNSQG